MNETISVSAELQAKFQQCDLDVQEFISALQSELVRLRKHNARLEVENLSLRERIKALQKEIEKKVDLQTLSDEELEWLTKHALEEALSKAKRTDEGVA
jgi:uncharacterized protein YaaN involved in tellurite resistance